MTLNSSVWSPCLCFLGAKIKLPLRLLAKRSFSAHYERALSPVYKAVQFKHFIWYITPVLKLSPSLPFGQTTYWLVIHCLSFSLSAIIAYWCYHCGMFIKSTSFCSCTYKANRLISSVCLIMNKRQAKSEFVRTWNSCNHNGRFSLAWTCLVSVATCETWC